MLEQLLGASVHVEILRRSHEIIKFLCSFGGDLSLSIVETIWATCGSDRHEATVSAIYELIISIADQLDLAALQLLKQKIAAIPRHAFSELTLNLVKGFVRVTSDQIGEDPTEEEIDLLCLDVLWEIVFEREQKQFTTTAEPLSVAVIESALMITKIILQTPQCE